MSLESWKEEFYPVEADDPSIKTNLQAVQHSIRKWEGLREENLAKHEVVRSHYGSITGMDGSFGIDSISCALCVRHNSGASSCRSCPLARARSGVSCDQVHESEWESPYAAWTKPLDKDRPTPMYMSMWLRQAEARLLREREYRKARVAKQK